MRDREVGLRSHLQELRRRLLISVLAVVVGVGLALAFYKPILRVLIHPIEPKLAEMGTHLVFVEVTEMFGVQPCVPCK